MLIVIPLILLCCGDSLRKDCYPQEIENITMCFALKRQEILDLKRCKTRLPDPVMQVICDCGIRKPPRGSRGGIRKKEHVFATEKMSKCQNEQPASAIPGLRPAIPIPIHVGSRSRTNQTQSAVCHEQHRRVSFSNLIQIETGKKHTAPILFQDSRPFNLCLINPCSVCNKAPELCDFTVDNALDVCVITETWLKGDERDSVILAELQPPGYKTVHAPRKGRGGGVAVIHKDSITVTSSAPHKFHSFESLECLMHTTPPLRLATIYRPPPSRSNGQTFKRFLEEISSYFEDLAISTGCLLVLGDFNVHVDNTQDKEGVEFMSLLETLGMKQHVSEATHRSGHTLDLVLTRAQDTLTPSVTVMDHCLSDHFPVFCHLPLSKPKPSSQVQTYRKLKAICPENFAEEINVSEIACLHADSTAESAVGVYNSTLREILDKHAPEKTRTVPSRPRAEWYTDQIRQAKQQRRQYERLWRRTKLTIHREMLLDMKKKVNSMISEAKTAYFKTLILDNKGDQRKLFSVVSRLLGKSQCTILPPGRQPSELVNEFSEFFSEKIMRIRAAIGDHGQHETESAPIKDPISSLDCWQPVTQVEVGKIIMASPTKSCSLDPIPTNLLKQCLPSLLPVITAIINSSLATGNVPSDFKLAKVTPLIKKPSLDPSLLSNYRPVSNLPFISKVLEKVVSIRLTGYLTENGLQEPMQSAYRKQHSTETALMRVQHDILGALSGQNACLMVLLDLSAAFDTVDHTQLLSTLRDLGIRGRALEWFASYLKDRHQVVSIGQNTSQSQQLVCGVPQGSVLGPVLFTVYTASLGKLLRSRKMNYQLYADDSSLYIMFRPLDILATVERVEQCVESVRQWMSQRSLKMNDSKSEVLLISSKQISKKVTCPSISIGGHLVHPSDVVKSVGVLLDKHASMEQHVTSVCKSSHYHLYNIGRIRKYLSKESTEQLIHAFITSKLDYCNALLCGLPSTLTGRLQRIQNIAARITTLTSSSSHITPVLYDLHWLPVAQRVKFKVLLMVYKCQHNMAPLYLQDLIRPQQQTRTLRSSGQNLLEVPFARQSSFCDRAFGVAGPRLWNSLPSELRCTSTYNVFKSNLKTFLFKEHFCR